MIDTQASRISRVRVADAPLLPPSGDLAIGSCVAHACRGNDGDVAVSALYKLLIAMTIIHFTSFLLLPDLPNMVSALVIARYILWPFITILFVIFLIKNGVTLVARVLAPFSPYFIIGVLSACLSDAPFDGLKLLVFWLLGTLASVTAGLGLKSVVALRTTFFVFFFMIFSSLLAIFLFPHFGVFNGAQSFLGSDWSGLFINKNVFGKICQCELLFALILTEMNRTLRLSVLGLASFLLLHSGSQSALIVAIFQSAYWICIPILRRRAHPAWVKSVIILGTLLASALVIILGRAPLLALLGRDATLTGRTDVWQVWINRAMQSFWLGAGPGSFTGNSSATADLTQAFSRYGTIYSPHNMYIGVFGEVGILGLITFTVPLIYMFAVLPFTREGRMPVICGLLAFTMALGGLSETQEVFGLGLNMFLLVLAYAPTAHRPSKSLLGVRAGISHGRQG